MRVFVVFLLCMVASQVHQSASLDSRMMHPVYLPGSCEHKAEKWLNCNVCRCLWAWATWTCTQNICTPQEMYGIRKECYHGDVKMDDCNKCVCQYGKWVCDNQICDAVCNDGLGFVVDCNTCICIGGKYRCTEYPCVIHAGTACHPGSKSLVNCNECTCNHTGIGLTCTDMDCF